MKVTQLCLTQWPYGLDSPWNSLGQNPGVGSLSCLQGIFPTQWSNPGLPHCRQIPYQLSHKESPRILEWVAYPFSSGSSWSRNQTGVSCIAGGFFTNWAIRGKPKIIAKWSLWWYSKPQLRTTVLNQQFSECSVHGPLRALMTSRGAGEVWGQNWFRIIKGYCPLYHTDVTLIVHKQRRINLSRPLGQSRTRLPVTVFFSQS